MISGLIEKAALEGRGLYPFFWSWCCGILPNPNRKDSPRSSLTYLPQECSRHNLWFGGEM